MMNIARRPFNVRTCKGLCAGWRPQSRRGGAGGAQAFSSSSSPPSDPAQGEEEKARESGGGKARGPVLVYKAMFAAKLKLLRRISLTSSISSVIGLPVVISLSGGDLSMAAKLAIGGTAVFASLASTAILHAITFPYVTNLWLLPPADDKGKEGADSAPSESDLRFRATTLNLLGNPVTKQFSLSEMEKIKVTSHPYANFRAGKDFFYVRTAGIQPESLSHQFASRCNAPSKAMKEI